MTTPTKKPHIVPYCEAQYQLIYADEHIIVVHKPNGLLSVPGRLPENCDSLITRVQEEFPTAKIVHRLDCETSGLLVLALNDESHRQMSKLFADRKIEKRYIAEVYGHPEEDNGEITLPLICDWPNRPRQKVCDEQGKSALTYYQVLSRGEQTSHVQLTPHTGRSHQLRVHMAELGHPILGDEFYAHKQAFSMADRMRLHAQRLAFEHPITSQALDFEMPADF